MNLEKTSCNVCFSEYLEVSEHSAGKYDIAIISHGEKYRPVSLQEKYIEQKKQSFKMFSWPSRVFLFVFGLFVCFSVLELNIQICLVQGWGKAIAMLTKELGRADGSL